jgi:hypothetical protein
MSSDDDDEDVVVRAPDVTQWSARRCDVCFDKLDADTAVTLPCACAHSICCRTCAVKVFERKPECSFCRGPIPSLESIRPLPLAVRNMLRSAALFCRKCRSFVREGETRETHVCATVSPVQQQPQQQQQDVDVEKSFPPAASTAAADKAQDGDGDSRNAGAALQEVAGLTSRPDVADAGSSMIGQRVAPAPGQHRGAPDVIEPSRTEAALRKAAEISVSLGEKVAYAAGVVGAAATSVYQRVTAATPAAAGASGV